MPLDVDFVYKCCSCERETRQRRRVGVDATSVPVPLEALGGWQTDGLGGWLCGDCYVRWSEILRGMKT